MKNPLDPPTFIYGFCRAGRFAYVGQTMYPHRRESQNRSVKPLTGYRFVILKKTVLSRAPHHERKFIEHFKAIGECHLNKKAHYTVSRDCNSVKYKGIIFPSWAALALHIGVSIKTLRKKGLDTRF